MGEIYYPWRNGVRLCARRSDFKALGAFFCNSNKSSPALMGDGLTIELTMHQYITSVI